MRIPRRRRHQTDALVKLGLLLNAGLLAAVLLVLLSRSGGPTFVAPAMAQQAPMPIAGGAGFFLMPAQFAANQWGCYVMDVDAQTLSVYQWDLGKKELQFKAGRSFVYDRQLKEYNTSPPPQEMRRAVEAEKAIQQFNGVVPATQP